MSRLALEVFLINVESELLKKKVFRKSTDKFFKLKKNTRKYFKVNYVL